MIFAYFDICNVIHLLYTARNSRNDMHDDIRIMINRVKRLNDIRAMLFAVIQL